MSGRTKAQRDARSRRRRAVSAKREARVAAARSFRDKPVVTIFADASYSHQTKDGGWGVWIKADGRPSFTKGGPFLGEVDTSSEAEVRALANALALGRAAGLIRDGDCIMLQSDCQAALCGIMALVETSCHRPAPGSTTAISPPKRIGPWMRKSAGLKTVVKIATEAQLKIVLRHVPGHKSGEGRAWVNRQVDKLAAAHKPKKKQEPAHV